MKPTAKLLEATTKPLHRAILLNFWRHVHLEGAGEYDKILAPDMIVDHPVYRVTWGANPAVIEGKDGVRAFYNSVGEAVLWHSDDRLAVADWGVCDEITFHQLAIGSDLRLIGYDVERADRLYHVYSRQAFIWPYDERARLAGEHLYEDKTSLRIEEVDRTEAITPARVREIHRRATGQARSGARAQLLGAGRSLTPSLRVSISAARGTFRTCPAENNMQKACRWTPAILAAALVPALASTAAPATQQQYQLVDPGPNGFTLKRVEVPVRAPGAGEVLVRVRAAALNRRDIYVIDGQYPIGSRTSLVPLSDGAGEVAAVGASVKRFRVGDRVAATFFQNWVNGPPAADTPMTALGGALDGMLSEYVTLNEAGLVKVPANLSYEEAATLPCAA